MHSVDLKLVMQLFLKDIIEVGSINVVRKYIHKKDTAVFHHIIHRSNIWTGRLYPNEIGV